MVTESSDQNTPVLEDFVAAGLSVTNIRELRLDAAGFIFSRFRSNQHLMSGIVKNVIEMGIALEVVYLTYNDPSPAQYAKLPPHFQMLVERVRLQHTAQGNDSSTWGEWCTKHLPFDEDTAKNYRNLARAIYERVKDTDPAVLNRTKLGALYKLAVKQVAESAQEWFFTMLLSNTELIGDKRLAVIAKCPEIRVRMEGATPELNVEQAYSLALAKPKVAPLVWTICLEERVKYGLVVEKLNELFLNWLKTPDNLKPDKTWHELKHNGFVLLFTDRDNVNHEIPLRDATPADLTMYLQARSDHHRLGSGVRRERARAQVERINGVTYLRLFDNTAIPPLFAGEIEVDILAKWEDREQKK